MGDLPRCNIGSSLQCGLCGPSVCLVKFLEAPAVLQAVVGLEVALVVLVHVELAGAFELVVK